MNKKKDKSKPEVKTPTPPQDINPSKPPRPGKEVLGDDGKGRDKKKDDRSH
jgi:hypothetical protein